MGKRTDLKTRLEAKFIRRSSEECWLWTAGKNNQGYGQIREGGLLPKKLAHRVSYELYVGKLGDSDCVLHKCDTPSCVNPSHLFVGTFKDNYNDMVAKGRRKIIVNPDKKPPHHFGSGHPNAIMTEQLVLEARTRYDAGWSLRRLMKAYGLKKRGLQHLLRGKTWPDVGGPISSPMLYSHEIFKGSSHPNSKLNENTVRAARDMRASGETFQSIADKLGVSCGTIHDCVTGKTWKHLD